MKAVLPEHDFIRLDVSHPIFHSFFRLQTLAIPHPMLPGIQPEFFGLFDDNRTSGRMLAIANFNNDIGDYWEWSAEGLYNQDADGRRLSARRRLSGVRDDTLIPFPRSSRRTFRSACTFLELP